MYISPITVKNNPQQLSLKKGKPVNSPVFNQTVNDKIFADNIIIPFGSQSKNKKIDPEKETKKLLKQFDDILISGMDPEESRQIYEAKMLMQMLSNIQKLEALYNELNIIQYSPIYDDMQKFELMYMLKERQKAINLDNRKLDKPFVPQKPLDKNIDLTLVNNFKTAILEDNFNLDKVYIKYYSGLKKVRSVEELNKMYPKMSLPSRAEDVISDKIVSVLTRDFFETLDRKMNKGNVVDIFNYCDRSIKNILKQSVKEPDEIYEKILDPVATKILDKRDYLNKTNSYTSVPEYRKTQNANITENDLKLLSVDYDDFVLSVLRQQYIDRKKPYEIKYTDGKTTINLSSLKENVYKFEKPSERIKTIINTAKEIQAAKRDYENFDITKIRASLDNWASQDIGNNEDIFERIIMFDSCRFTEGDKKAIIRFLRILDSVKDGDISEYEALEKIKTEDLRPIETEQINQKEKERIIEVLRNQQKEAIELKYLRARFDKAMDNLYKNDMGGIAVTAAKYRPADMKNQSVQNAEFIINTVSDEKITDKIRVKNMIKNWDTYNYFKESTPESEILQKAEQYARRGDGEIDIMKAGRYISNTMLVLNAPQSLENLKDKDIQEEIITRAEDKDAAVEGLCKYNEYNELNPYEKSHIQEFLDIFEIKNPIDKFILKNIIENDYINTDTVSQVILNDTDKTNATISARAKRQILEKYRFPRCIEFMYGFEKALTTISSDKGTSGIKKITKNNRAMEYKMELKLINHDDRIFASQEDYYFDVFSDKGLH